MPYKDWGRQREYQKQWKRRRKEEFLGSSICLHCGATEGLQIHHLDPAEKEDHRIWSWSRERILNELSKCIVLCHSCHVQAHLDMIAKPTQAEIDELQMKLSVQLFRPALR